MKILMVSRPARGGIKSHVQTLLNKLPNYNILPKLIAPRSYEDIDKDICHQIIPLEINDGLDLRDDWQAVLELKNIIYQEAPALIHAHGYKAALLVNSATQLTGWPWICTLHNFRTWQMTRPLLKSFYGLAIKGVLNGAEKIICVSNSLRQEMLTLGIQKEKLHMLYNGITLSDFHKPVNTVPHQVFSRQEKLVGCISRLNRDKGIENFLYAIRYLFDNYSFLITDKVQFVIVGDGPDRDRLEQLAWELKIASKVTFLGYRRDISNILKRLTLLSIPSKQEGLSITALEAMASMCPVVAANTGGLSEIVIDGKTGLLYQNHNPRELARDITILLSSRRYRRELALKAYQYAMEFSDDKMAREIVWLYRGVNGVDQLEKEGEFN